jgi:hypothetical protein
MLARLKTCALVGIEAAPVEAEVDVSAGRPKKVLVGTKRPQTFIAAVALCLKPEAGGGLPKRGADGLLVRQRERCQSEPLLRNSGGEAGTEHALGLAMRRT